MLPSQKIKLLMENRETFLNQNKIAHLPLPHTRSLSENFNKIHGSAWCNGGMSEFGVTDDGSNPNK